MKKLPKLIKQPDRNYIIGIDLATEGNNELFTFSVLYKKNTEILIEQIETLINKVDYKINGPTKEYIKELVEYYNSPIYKGNGL